MPRTGRKPLRPEDATSFEEFQARCAAARTQSFAIDVPYSARGKVLLLVLSGSGAGYGWWRIVAGHGLHDWGGFLLPFAIFLGLNFLRSLLLFAVWGLCVVFWRRRLRRLRKQWRAKAERGEIPWSAPSEPKVWQDELEARSSGENPR
jgi:hypothetical protein